MRSGNTIFFFSVTDPWNSLPGQVFEVPMVKAFERKLDRQVCDFRAQSTAKCVCHNKLALEALINILCVWEVMTFGCNTDVILAYSKSSMLGRPKIVFVWFVYLYVCGVGWGRGLNTLQQHTLLPIHNKWSSTVEYLLAQLHCNPHQKHHIRQERSL